ncbi:hypothetical protein ABIC02_007501 [Bradyrhizobium sp. RT5a]
MRFEMPMFPCEFELPDDWLAEADWLDDFGHRTFQPAGEAYRSTSEAMLVVAG